MESSGVRSSWAELSSHVWVTLNSVMNRSGGGIGYLMNYGKRKKTTVDSHSGRRIRDTDTGPGRGWRLTLA